MTHERGHAIPCGAHQTPNPAIEMSDADGIRAQMLELSAEYYAKRWGMPAAFVPGVTPIPVSGKVFDGDEVAHLIDAALDFWLTTGRFAARFEKEFAAWMTVRHCLLVNSGSSANLVALSALTSKTLGTRALKPGDEVITCAAGFPTTVNPILQNGLVPVFVDAQIPTYNIDASQLEDAWSPRVRAIMLAHTLGNPFDVEQVMRFAERHDLWVIEDTCDAVGAEYAGKKVGSFGDLATVSFYPAHHITMGEGGAVLTRWPRLKTLVESFRDWGRDCWCEPGKDNTCGKRFCWKLGDLPSGYDHKYTYSHIGYNLKLTDMQAAVGIAQLSKLPDFIRRRQVNFQRLHDGLQDLQDFFVLPVATVNSVPSWFGFPITVRDDAPFTRDALTHRLEESRIATRLLFGGNLTRQPAYQDASYRTFGNLPVADRIMNQTLWIGVYPGLTPDMLDFVIETLHSFCEPWAK